MPDARFSDASLISFPAGFRILIRFCRFSQVLGLLGGRGEGGLRRAQLPARPRRGVYELRRQVGGPSSHGFYPRNYVGRGWEIGNGAFSAVRLPKILVLRARV